MTIALKSFPQVLEDLVAYVTTNTSITDMNPGSVALTMLEATAHEDSQQYMSMVDIIRTFNLDTTYGEDLDERALEYGLTRLLPITGSGYVVFSDSAFNKVSSKLYSGVPGPIAGQSYIYIESALKYTPTGTVIIGRGTNRTETITYNNIAVIGGGVYYRLDLSVGLSNDHGTEETVILSQGGDRLIPAGTEVYVEASDVNPQITFVSIDDATILDGEIKITDILVRCIASGSQGNVSVGAIRNMTSPPIATISVSNEESFVNGADLEDDASLRDRIKVNIQSLSRATKATLLGKIVGIEDDIQQATVKSASFIEATVLDQPSYLYIDDGTGLEPTYDNRGYEVILEEATGGERHLQFDYYPLVKASLITVNEEPYELDGGMTLQIKVNDETENITLQDTAFLDITAATAEEVAAHINELSALAEARTTGGRKKVIIQARDIINERIQIVSATPPASTDANSILGFRANVWIETANIYKNDTLLNKDGTTASMVTTIAEPYNITSGQVLEVIVDGKVSNVQTITFTPGGFLSAQNVVDIYLNVQMAGATAEVTAAGGVRITSNTVGSSDSSIVANAGGANIVLGFPTIAVTGQNADYEMNKYNGQLRLNTALVPYDKITAGDSNVRAWVRCTTAEPYGITAGQTLIINVDSVSGVGDQTYTFGSTGSYTAAQIVATVNAALDPANRIQGITLFEHTIGTDTYLAVRTNTWDETNGDITYSTTSTAVNLDFSTTPASNQTPTHAYSESANTEDYTMGRDQNLIVVLDNDVVDRTFNTTMHVAGTVSTDVNITSFEATGLSTDYANNDIFIDCDIQFATNTTTILLRDTVGTITDWDAPSGTITVGIALAAIPQIGDTFTIIPRTAANVIDLFNNTNFSTLSVFANIDLSYSGTKVQVSAVDPGSDKSVWVTGGTANNFSIALVSDGTIAGTCTTDSIAGLAIGELVTLTNNVPTSTAEYVVAIAGSGPYTITFDDTWPASVTPDLSAYTIATNSVISDNNNLDFDTSLVEGVDGYKYYTGLLREVQWQLDGLDTDLVTYPGWKAAGVQIEVATPVIKPLAFTLDITTKSGYTLGQVTNAVKGVVSMYVNSLKIGEDVILIEIATRIQPITGIADIEIMYPADNVVITDNELARTRETYIDVG